MEKNKQNKYYIKSPTLPHPIQSQNQKPLCLFLSVFEAFLSLSLFRSRPNRHLHSHGF